VVEKQGIRVVAHPAAFPEFAVDYIVADGYQQEAAQFQEEQKNEEPLGQRKNQAPWFSK
jgi:hypothetical protein